MKNIIILLFGLACLQSTDGKSQNPVIADPKATQVQAVSVKGDTVYTIVLDKEHQISVPGYPTEYSIANYKNFDYLKIDPFELESSGLKTEIYISNTNQGVIIISSAEADDKLKDFSRTLELNPAYYESITRQDTIIFPSGNKTSQSFDFTKASSINHDYKNAFNYTVDPRTGVSWSKGTHKDFLQSDILGKAVYDLIIVRPKK